MNQRALSQLTAGSENKLDNRRGEKTQWGEQMMTQTKS